MGKLDEDLREVLRIKARSDAIYMEGTEEATQARQAAEKACFGFIHEHGYKVMALYHLEGMAKADVARADFMARTLGPDWKEKVSDANEDVAAREATTSATEEDRPRPSP